MLLETLSEEINLGTHTVVLFAKGDRPADLKPEFVWIDGDPTKGSELAKGRVAYAAAVVIIGSRAVLPQAADALTILVAFTIRKYMTEHEVTDRRDRPLYMVAEILETENVDHARTAGIDEVIETTRIGYSLVAHALEMPGMSAVVGGLADLKGNCVYVGRCPEGIELPQTFGDLATQLRKSHHLLLIGIRAGHGLPSELNPPDGMAVLAGQELVYIADSPLLTEVKAIGALAEEQRA
jgi:hypothetical protein